jgi:septal ring factor EnvC (AmiA/AmiB activator)
MRRKTDEQTAGELRIELRQVRAAVSEILDDYEQTANTVDELTAQIDGVETTNRAANVQRLKDELLTALQSDADTVAPPWERQGYATKQAWLDDE